jgi:acyl-coenzyme A synthetase/AMP-(fatty) acid ligase
VRFVFFNWLYLNLIMLIVNETRGIAFLHAEYGTTELMTVLAPSVEHENPRGSSGRPVPGVVVKVNNKVSSRGVVPLRHARVPQTL